MGVDGCWCAPRSSKPVRGVKSLSGEFDPHMLPPEPRGRVPRGFLKNVDFPLDRTEGSSYNTTVRDVSRTTSYPGVAQLVARMVRDHEAASSSLATPTIMWRQKRCLLRKARIDRAFLLPKRRFFSVPKHRCKIAVFPLWIDLNSRKVNIRYARQIEIKNLSAFSITLNRRNQICYRKN